jgi:hypothetical protein
MEIEKLNISGQHLEELKAAKFLLENPGLAAKLTNLVGKPIEVIFQTLPSKWKDRIHDITHNSLLKAIEFLSRTFEPGASIRSQESRHKLAVVASGAIGGAFGLGALTVELPFSTIIMLRSIMDIARSEGEIVEEAEAKLACMEVFALGGTSPKDDSTELGYYAVRMALARSLSEAADYIAERGLAERGAPIVIRYMTKIASRFGVVVSEKAAAQSLPIIGSIMGASINAAFIDHFQNVARGHFIVRKLERFYGKERVEIEYRNISPETA